jgi:serine acetyltransferase
MYHSAGRNDRRKLGYGRSLVNRDVPKNMLVAGVPVKMIRELEIPEGWIRQ